MSPCGAYGGGDLSAVRNQQILFHARIAEVLVIQNAQHHRDKDSHARVEEITCGQFFAKVQLRSRPDKNPEEERCDRNRPLPDPCVHSSSASRMYFLISSTRSGSSSDLNSIRRNTSSEFFTS